MTSGLDRPARWAAGTTFVPTGDGWLVHGPDEDFLVLSVPPEDRAAVADLFSGRLGVRAALERLPEAADLVAELTVPLPEPGPTAPASTEELPADAPAATSPIARPVTAPSASSPAAAFSVTGPAATSSGAAEVLLLGDGPLLAPLARCLRQEGLAVRHAAAGQDPGPGTAVLVACAEHLPDTAWRGLDARCRDRGIAWHRGHSEGRRWYVGPFTPPADGAGYEDLRLRRLAACPWPDELAAYWAFLDAGGRPATPADPAGAEVAAALIAADLRAWADGARPPGTRRQTGIDLAAGEIRHHPVLPVPGGLMREIPR
ncbi:TOMM precursor leader peptide-binding protein [Planobispora siamensis]|uniref:Uncharacterized protein n=1 Tax=Planobispora siamensis TaxID=936338 RepID=A0A8J3WMJ0_9ACTN|nr:TOMM precursor leader peptide-binding protein [Planobispora siamensis]GIH94685.1 hypothetical protein Psi01_53150 [Planobispora siamensis]